MRRIPPLRALSELRALNAEGVGTLPLASENWGWGPMSLWVIVTPQQCPLLRRLVTQVVGTENLPDGRFLWTVEASDKVMEALAEATEGYLSVERCGYIATPLSPSHSAVK